MRSISVRAGAGERFAVRGGRGVVRVVVLLFLGLFLVGCAGRREFIGERPFEFGRDTFAYNNELVWEYYFDDAGKWTHRRRTPEPDYTHHCFAVARAARQFFQHARFDPSLPRIGSSDYRRLIRRVVAVDPARTLQKEDRIVIPGYANLREFSEEHEDLLKAECGGAWRSYFQRGHWRMVFPISRRHQERAAMSFQEALGRNRPPVIHIVRFPQLTINHAVLLFDSRETDQAIVFAAYDPNDASEPKELTYDRASRTFYFPQNDYFPGGPVDAYEIYRSWNY